MDPSRESDIRGKKGGKNWMIIYRKEAAAWSKRAGGEPS